MLTTFRIGFKIFALALGSTALCSFQAAAGDAKHLVLGSISDNLTRENKTFQPLLDHLKKNLTDAGVMEVSLTVVTSLDAMVDEIASGNVDLYIDSPFAVAEIGRRAPLKPILRRWKGGVAEYHSKFVTRADSPIHSIDDLKGKVIAFDEPFSTSGYLMPKAMLLEANHTVQEVRGTDASVPSDTIGYTFSGDDVNTVFWVIKGKVVAGITDPKHFAKISEKRPGEMREFARSMDVPRHVAAIRPNLDTALSERLVDVLVKMDDDPSGREALHAFQKTTRFDEIPNAVATFEAINAMLNNLTDPKS